MLTRNIRSCSYTSEQPAVLHLLPEVRRQVRHVLHSDSDHRYRHAAGKLNFFFSFLWTPD
jgi:hypothetical protein